jgi:hypothetical protein
MPEVLDWPDLNSMPSRAVVEIALVVPLLPLLLTEPTRGSVLSRGGTVLIEGSPNKAAVGPVGLLVATFPDSASLLGREPCQWLMESGRPHNRALERNR